MKKVIVTVGPSALNRVPLNNYHKNMYIYRINGAHGEIEDIENYIEKIRSQISGAQILIDLPGNKVRTANLAFPIELIKGKCFELLNHQMNYRDFYKHLNEGNTVLANDSTLSFIVKEATQNKIVFYSESDGELLNNKGMHVRGIHKDIPFLFEKDKKLIDIANKYQVSYVGLSFVRNRDDIREAKEMLDSNIKIISKVETKAAVDNLNNILDEVEYILIDRGDLSTEVGLEKIPAYQKFIIEKALFNNIKVFLATQFLKNMEEKPIPTIPEIIDMYNTFKTGVYGIQLSEETAIGKYPKECLDTVLKMIEQVKEEEIVVPIEKRVI